MKMLDPTISRTRMTAHAFAGSASSDSPVPPVQASSCFLDQLDLRRPQARAAMESSI